MWFARTNMSMRDFINVRCEQCGKAFIWQTKTSVSVYVCVPCKRREKVLLKKYRLTANERAAIASLQRYRCKICGRPDHESRGGSLFVDHDSKTRKVRGLLCHRCNFMLGLAGDSIARLETAIEYLESELQWEAPNRPSFVSRALLKEGDVSSTRDGTLPKPKKVEPWKSKSRISMLRQECNQRANSLLSGLLVDK